MSVYLRHLPIELFLANNNKEVRARMYFAKSKQIASLRSVCGQAQLGPDPSGSFRTAGGQLYWRSTGLLVPGSGESTKQSNVITKEWC